MEPRPKETLRSQLEFWNRQEVDYRKLLKGDPLQDKDFLKMKLGFYDELWLKYRHERKGPEAKLWQMMQLQRRKLAKALLGRRLGRLTRWIKNRFKQGIVILAEKREQRRRRRAAGQIPLSSYDLPILEQKEESPKQDQPSRQTNINKFFQSQATRPNTGLSKKIRKNKGLSP